MFFIQLILFGSVFVYLTRGGIDRNPAIIAGIMAAAIMFVQKLGGEWMVSLLGTGINMFLMCYDIIIIAMMLMGKKPVVVPKATPDKADDDIFDTEITEEPFIDAGEEASDEDGR